MRLITVAWGIDRFESILFLIWRDTLYTVRGMRKTPCLRRRLLPSLRSESAPTRRIEKQRNLADSYKHARDSASIALVSPSEEAVQILYLSLARLA
jgi:hypothetical protein